MTYKGNLFVIVLLDLVFAHNFVAFCCEEIVLVELLMRECSYRSAAVFH